MSAFKLVFSTGLVVALIINAINSAPQFNPFVNPFANLTEIPTGGLPSLPGGEGGLPSLPGAEGGLPGIGDIGLPAGGPGDFLAQLQNVTIPGAPGVEQIQGFLPGDNVGTTGSAE